MVTTTSEPVRLPLLPGSVFYGGTLQTFDPSNAPEGSSFETNDLVWRSGHWRAAAPWVASAVITNGACRFMLFENVSASRTDLLAVKSRLGSATLFSAHGTGTENFSSAGALANATMPTGYTNFKGRVFFSTSLVYSYDGTTIKQNALGGETIYATALATFNSRIFLGAVSVSIANQLTVAQSYDPTTSWATSNVTAEKITNGTTIVGRISPTSASAAQLYLKDIYTAAAATTDTYLRYWCDLRNTSAVYSVPVKIQVYYSQIWVSGATYAVGAIRVPTTATGNGFRYRVSSITTGVAAAGEPAWTTTVGATVVDGGVTWICDGTDACGSMETTIDNTSDEPNFQRNSVLARIGPNPQSTKVGIRIVYGNTTSPTFTQTSLEMSLRDGLTDSSLSKRNRGQQLTVGRFAYDFFNQESSATATITHTDRIYWTEVLDETDVRGNNYYKCEEIAGPITAIATVGQRIVVFKERGMWVFSGTSDPDIPIRLESFYDNIGSLGSYAAFTGTLYFSNGDGVYAWRPGGPPDSVSGEALYERFTTYSNFCHVAVDSSAQEVWVTSRVNDIAYVYSIPTKKWVSRTLTGLGGGDWSIFYYPVSGHMVIGDSNDLGCYTHTASNVFLDAGSNFTATWTPRYLRAPDGKDLIVNNVWFRTVRAAGAGATLTMSVTYVTGGSEVTKTTTYNLPTGALAREFSIPIAQRGDSFAFTFTITTTDTNNSVGIADCAAECEMVDSIPSLIPTYVSGAL